MKKLIIIMLITLSITKANAFYTSFEDDIKTLKEGVYSQQKGTVEQKDAFIKRIVPTIRQARDQAYNKIAVGCAADVIRMCSKYQENVDLSVKCLSDNKRMLSSACRYVIQQNFRAD
jgi:uncharacterized protein YdbL (DUF1318 family)